MPTSHTLTIDFGSRYIGLALVRHSAQEPNRVRYAATIEADPAWLKKAVEPRAQIRRLRRTRKTHRARLRRLAQALARVPGSKAVLRFCRRRGYGYDADESVEDGFRVPREDFFKVLQSEIARWVPAEHRARALNACSRHLNETRRRDAELRPARFENRGRARCQWSGCNKNVPRAENAVAERLAQSLAAWLKPVFDVSPDPQALRQSLDHWVKELGALARAYARAKAAPEPERSKQERARVQKRVTLIYRTLLRRVAVEAPAEIASSFKDDWQAYYRRMTSDVVHGEQGGRLRYCCEHSRQFVDFFLAGSQIPNRQEVDDRDLISRRQQIIFQRLWRLVELRILPMADSKIDRVIVERVAFDALGGRFKDRQKTSDEKAAAMYWEGPQYRYASRIEMLKAEFAGHCAYCGQTTITADVEHILPRSAFPFDSYLNVVPACDDCNRRKGPRTPLEAGMSICREAYEAYCSYVGRQHPPHHYHEVKKGLLNLLVRPSGNGQAERLLGMLANNLVQATNTQRGPRPLGRYLATKIERRTGARPATLFINGRHTALYRRVALPEFEKAVAKDVGDLRNHAIDAILLGCQFPSASALENRVWYRTAGDVWAWREKVRSVAPMLDDGIPAVDRVEFVPFFEQDLGGGYCLIDLKAFNWNRERRGTHDQDPFGQTRSGRLLKRIPAATILAALKDRATRGKQIEAIANAGLRRHLSQDNEHAPVRFVAWLQKTTIAGLRNGTMSVHPADVARKKLLERFVQARAEEVVASQEQIPSVIGVRCVSAVSTSLVEVERCDTTGRTFQRYKADPPIKEAYVCYRRGNAEIDANHPVVFFVNQIYALKEERAGKRVHLKLPDDSPLRGRPLGSSGKLKDFLARWRDAFDALCGAEGLVQRFRLTQGCVIEKADGSFFQLRNFDKGQKWMKSSPFRNIVRVHRSPLRLITARASTTPDPTEAAS